MLKTLSNQTIFANTTFLPAQLKIDLLLPPEILFLRDLCIKGCLPLTISSTITFFLITVKKQINCVHTLYT